MNANAKKWVRALRSGKFKQAMGQLAVTGPAFCCLGVACELAKKAGAIKNYRWGDGMLPTKVVNWLGLSTTDGRFKRKIKVRSTTTSLVHLNDTEKKTFKQIAKVIESEPKGLFRK